MVALRIALIALGALLAARLFAGGLGCAELTRSVAESPRVSVAATLVLLIGIVGLARVLRGHKED